MRIDRYVASGNGDDVSSEQAAIMWLRNERELVTTDSCRRAPIIESKRIYSLSKFHLNDPTVQNDSRSEF